MNHADIWQHHQQYILNIHNLEILGLLRRTDQKHDMTVVLQQFNEVISHIIMDDIQEVHSVQ